MNAKHIRLTNAFALEYLFFFFIYRIFMRWLRQTKHTYFIHIIFDSIAETGISLKHRIGQMKTTDIQ